MTTLALITMLIAQGIIIAATLYFYKLVLKKPNSGAEEQTKDTSEA